MSRFIPLSIPNFEGNEKKYVLDAVEQGWVSTGGAYITRLEKQIAEYLHTENVAACQSGTSGIHLALIECGVMPDDIVLVPALTFIAAVNPVRYQFAEPVFMDCDNSLCMDPVKLRRFCEEECIVQNDSLIEKRGGQKVKAIIVVHVFGNLADMEAIMDIAEEYHLKVIEDATEALGSKYTEGRYAGQYAGTIGDFGSFSFNGNKIITTGGGGAVTGRDAAAVDHMRYLSTQAKDDPHFYIHHEVGFNYRMTNLQAALGVAQMEELEDGVYGRMWGLCHGDCNQHNIVFSQEGWTLVNFEQMSYDVMVQDLANFVRKIMEKHNFSTGLGIELITAYDNVRKLLPEELEQLYLRLAYPKKFWKIANHYSSSRKSWISGRDIEKLEKVMDQEAQRKQFLNMLFYFTSKAECGMMT